MNLVWMSFVLSACSVPFSHETTVEVEIPLELDDSCDEVWPEIVLDDGTRIYGGASLIDGTCYIEAYWEGALIDSEEIRQSVADAVTEAGFSEERIGRIDFLSMDFKLDWIYLEDFDAVLSQLSSPISAEVEDEFDSEGWSNLAPDQLQGFTPPPIFRLSGESDDTLGSELAVTELEELSLGPIEVKGEDKTLYALDLLYADGKPFNTLGEALIVVQQEDLHLLNEQTPTLVVGASLELTGQMWVDVF